MEANTTSDDQRTTAAAGKVKRPKALVFISVLFLLNIFLTVCGLIFIDRDLVTYTPSTLMDWLNVVLEVVLLWMIHCRYRLARPFVLVYTVVNVAVGAIVDVATGIFDPLSFLFGSAFDIFLFLYFLLSKGLKATLTEPFSLQRDREVARSDELVINRRSWPFYRNLIIYYCFFSLAGHWMEAGFCQLIRLGLVNGEYDPTNTMLWRDWFYPFPMEGLAVVIIGVALYPLWRWLLKKCKYNVVACIISFVVNGLVCVTIEYTMGLFVNADLQLWDYSDMPFNLNGMICLQNGVGFAFAASIIAWFVYPALERLFQRLPKNVMQLVFVVTVAAYAIPQTLYLIDPPGQDLAEQITFLEDYRDGADLTEEDRQEVQEEIDRMQEVLTEREKKANG